jgi:hypothetical protein
MPWRAALLSQEQISEPCITNIELIPAAWITVSAAARGSGTDYEHADNNDHPNQPDRILVDMVRL